MLAITSNLKQLLDEGFRNIKNYQGRGKRYQPKPKAEVDNTYRDRVLSIVLLVSFFLISRYINRVNRVIVFTQLSISQCELCDCPRKTKLIQISLQNSNNMGKQSDHIPGHCWVFLLYHKMPLISPGLILVRKGFWVG